MTQLILTLQESDMLLQAIQEYESELRMEIAATDRQRFRDQLKTTKGVLHTIIEKLQKSRQEEPSQLRMVDAGELVNR